MQIAIVDDNELDSKLLSSYIKTYSYQSQILPHVEIFSSSQSFLKSFECTTYHVVFLDVYIDEINGMNIAEKIREKDEKVIIIFNTCSLDHAIRGYRVRATDYLVKPCTYSEFEKTINHCTKIINNQSRFIEVKDGRIFVKILLSEIVYVDYSNHYIQIHTRNRIIKSYQYFDDFAPTLLEYDNFLHCYRNCIINMDEVATLDVNDFIMKTKERIPIAKAKRTMIRQQYADYKFKKLEES